MRQRVVVGFLAILVLVGLLVSDASLAAMAERLLPSGVGAQLVKRGSLILLLLSGLILVAGLELLHLFRLAGLRPHPNLSLGTAVLVMLAPWVCSAGVFGSTPSTLEGFEPQLILLALLVLATATMQLARPVSIQAVADIAATWMIVLYLGVLPSFVVRMRSLTAPGADGAFLVLIFVLVTKAADIGGYFVGTVAGRHKLLPSVSPGKSVEGMLGGIGFSVAVAYLLWWLCNFLSQYGLAGGDERLTVGDLGATFARLSSSQVLVFAILMVIAGLLGDLFESVLKRAARQKDSASLLPSYGGMLDMIDSPIMAAPVAWFMLTVWWEI